jgi:TM2 domain-containing membrane protein YozV
MNCYQHPDIPAVAFCRNCGQGLCAACERPAEGTVFCQEHLPAANSSTATPRRDPGPNPYFQPSASAVPIRTSPGLAFILGLIPGVGAIYNGQYLKGFIHAAVFGLLMSISSSMSGDAGQSLLVALVMGWYFYMPFEAYHTAKKRQMGIPVDEWSSLVSSRSWDGGRLPVGPVLLIVLGVVFLLDELNILPIRDLVRFWPVILIALGIYLLYSRLSGPARLPAAPPPPVSAPPAATGNVMGAPNEH